MVRTLVILIGIGIAAKVWGPFHIDYSVLEVAAIIAAAVAITYFKQWRETETYRARMANYLEARGLMADFAEWVRGPSQPATYVPPTPWPLPAGDGQESQTSADELKAWQAVDKDDLNAIRGTLERPPKASPSKKWAELVEDASHDPPRGRSTLGLYDPAGPKTKT
jgi:hypothetical protein